jgi:BTB/POZ domain-containing protein KCTD9
LNRIYKGTDNKFTKKSWDDNCLNKGPTLTVVQADNGRIFGGYISQSWTKKEGNYDFYTQDDKAWIFSFDHSTQLKVTQPQYAIQNYYGHLCGFGGGWDLGIRTDAHNNGGWSNLGHSYELPAGIVYGSEQAKSYLAGVYQFKIKEVEVFSVTLKH